METENKKELTKQEKMVIGVTAACFVGILKGCWALNKRNRVLEREMKKLLEGVDVLTSCVNEAGVENKRITGDCIVMAKCLVDVTKK